VTVVSGTGPQIARVLATYNRQPNGTMIHLGGKPGSAREGGQGGGGLSAPDLAVLQALFAFESGDDSSTDPWHRHGKKHP
jgi:hypothetical protein